MIQSAKYAISDSMRLDCLQAILALPVKQGARAVRIVQNALSASQAITYLLPTAHNAKITVLLAQIQQPAYHATSRCIYLDSLAHIAEILSLTA